MSDKAEFPEHATLDELDPQLSNWVRLGLGLFWKPKGRRIYIQSLTVNGSNVLPPEGSGDPESPFPDPPPLDIGWKKRGTACALEWKLRVFDEVSAIGLYVIERGSTTWRKVAESGIIKAGDPWADKGSYVP